MKYVNHELGWGVEPIIYGYSPTHKHILRQYGEPYNIGRNGSNLTIMLLSQNRSSSTSDLLCSINDHIPNFEGDVLIVDNRSVESEKNILKELIGNMPYRARLIELDQNYGVAGGRNRGVQHVKTLWIMSVDNDMYFICNPLAEIEKTIEQFGCHFINMPFLKADGKSIEADGGTLGFDEQDGEILAWQGSMFKPAEGGRGTTFTPSIGTFLFGAGSLYRKDTFLSCGGYDEGMFVGFEDTDFSMTLFRKGYKVVNCGRVCLVHNHRQPDNDTDKDAERIRHSRERLKVAGDYFKQKNNINIWNEQVETWVEQREKDLGLLEEGSNPTKFKEERSWLPKIALVMDSRNWAYDNISRQIIKHLSPHYNFIRIYTSDPEYSHLARVLYAAKGSDLVHVFWRPSLNNIHSDWELNYIKEFGGDVAQFVKEFLQPLKFSTAVYDHLYLNGEDFKVHTTRFAKYCDHYYTASNKLDCIYKALHTDGKIDKAPEKVIPDGVDLSRFKPENIERLAEAVSKRPLKLGWTGNSDWLGYDDLKGIRTVIKPAVENLKREGYRIDLEILDRKNGTIPHDKMPEFYNSIDIYVCASEIEGTPNTVLEAMACGVPVISTDVGIVPDAFGDLQKAYIFERNVSDLEAKIKRIIDTPDMLEQLSRENQSSIKGWDWAVRVQSFKEFFDMCLGTNN